MAIHAGRTLARRLFGTSFTATVDYTGVRAVVGVVGVGLRTIPSPSPPQEVETDQYFNYFLPQLSSQGYEGIFQPKSRARTMQEEERKHVDGCAIFYHNSK